MTTQLIIRLKDPNPEGVFRVDLAPDSPEVSVEVSPDDDAAYLNPALEPFNCAIIGLLSDSGGATAFDRSFPLYVESLRRRNANWDRRLALYFRLSVRQGIHIEPIVASLLGLKQVVETVTRARNIQPAQGPQDYVEPSSAGGLDVKLSWNPAILSGRGEKVQICLIDKGFWPDHPFLDTPPGTNIHSTNHQIAYIPGTGPGPKEHGTSCLGVLVAKPDGLIAGVVHQGPVTGIVHQLDKCWVSSLYTTGAVEPAVRAAREALLPNALDLPLGSDPGILKPGDVILVPYATDEVADGGELPVEADSDVRTCLRMAAEVDGLIVVESAGNGGPEGGLKLDDYADIISSESSSEHSLAVIVGAGHAPGSDAPFTAMKSSNYGNRVDCQAWGEGITTTAWTTDFQTEVGNTSVLYHQSFGLTSAASSIVAGVAAVVQSVHKEVFGEALSPIDLRRALRNAGQQLTTEDAKHIGPLPDIRELLWQFKLLPNLYLRDGATDPGVAALNGSQSFLKSLDIIPRRQKETYPEAAFGGTNWNVDCGQNLKQDDPSWIYLRIQNAGPFKDESTVRLYWTKRGNESSPSEWKQIGQDVPLSLAAEEKAVIGGLKRQATTVVGNLCLIAVVSSKFHRELGAAPESILPEDLDFLRQHRKIAYRRVTTEKKCCSCLFS